MKTLNEAFATFRQPLGVFFVLVGGGAALAALSTLLLPALPTGLQRTAADLLGGVPGVYRGLEMTREDPVPTGSLRLELGERIVARFPATDEAWSTSGFELQGPALPVLLAGWGAVVGLLLHLLWFVSPSRQVLGLALMLGVASGWAVAHTIPKAPRYWASFWLRGVGGLPGLEEIQGSPVGIENLPSSATLISLGGRLAEYPPETPPWPSEAVVKMHGRGRAWFASYGVVGWLSLFLIAAAFRARRWRWRVIVGALGLGLSCWIILPFLPDAVGNVPMSRLAGYPVRGGGFSVELPGGLELLRSTRLGFGVGLGLLPLLVAAWFLALTPLGLLGGGLAAWRRRSAGKFAEARDEEDRTPVDPIPVTDRDEPAWLSDYEERRGGDAADIEPHPAGGDEEP